MIDIKKDEETNIEFKFQSTFQILIHLFCSSIQLLCICAIIALQIILIITQTCSYRITIGFLSLPFLIIAPISIWIFIWKRNKNYFFLVFIIHICSNLFATGIIILSFLILIEIICIVSNNYSLSINISLIILSIFLKIFLYSEIILLYIFQYNNQQSSIRLKKHYQILLNNLNIKTLDKLKSDSNYYENLNV